MRAAWILALSALFGVAAAEAQAPGALAPSDAGTAPPASAEPADAGAVAAPLSEGSANTAQAEQPLAPAPTASDPMLEQTMTEAELQGLGFSASSPAVDTSLKLSGFMDFGTIIALTKQTRALAGSQAFGIGNLNVYISKNLSETIRTMAEVRFTYLPNGSPQSQQNPTRTNTFTTDYADFGRATLHWGGIEIERAFLEWAAHRWLTIRAGSFLTPYGIWNVDHGTPTIIMTNRPYVIGLNYFPERQTGFELYGRADVGSYSTVGYHLTLSNGTGPFTEYADLDKNKAIGGRLLWEYRKRGELRIGASAYYGRDTSAVESGTLVNGTPKTIKKVTSQSDQLGLAVDAVWRYAGFHAQAEFIARQTKYTAAGRTALLSLADLRTHYPADNISWGTYLLLGYRFEWGGVMPFFVVQRTHDVTGLLTTEATPILVGLNVRPIDALALKVEYMHVIFDDEAIFPRGKLNIINAQAAWAF